MRILITGGAGFIGSHLSDRLIAEFSGRPYTPSELVLRSQGQTGIGQPITAPRAAL